MKKNPKIFLLHIVESITQIDRYTKKLTKTKFLKNTQIQDAVIRRLEIIGEAVKNVSPEIRKRHSFIPWKKIAGSRDVLSHSYYDVDIELVWETVKKDIPRLKKEIQKILNAG